jgi:hypothetical protein
MPRNRSTQSALSVATNPRRSVEDRVAALAEVPLAACEDANLQTLLDILRNLEEPAEVRYAALQTLQAASFSVLTFEPCRADYIAALRQVVDDPDPELRQRVLGILAREHDGLAQRKLLDGLQRPDRALVPPEKALQLLSYDVHADAYPVAREIVNDPPNTAAKREALRLLAADVSAAPLFERVLRDKNELLEVRQISAASLHAVRPERLQKLGREILLDTSESEEIQTTCLTALTQFGDVQALAEDTPLLKRVHRLSGDAGKRLKLSARDFLNKYEP